MKVKTNAVVESTQLGICDHGILTAWVNLKWGECGQAFGGFALDSAAPERREGSRRKPSAACGLFIARVCEVVGVEYWEDLAGKPCRILRNDHGIEAIGNFITEEWFYPSSELNSLPAESKD